jgi:nitrogen fixation-related uncharacterized protein
MTNNQYITALKKALSGLDRASRNDIIKEIQGSAAESTTPLVERFGSADELAKQYLDGVIVAKPIAEKIWGLSKKLFIAIGIAVVAAIVIISLLIWSWSGDKFDYADENSPELSKNKATWVTKPWTSNLDIKVNQSSSVFYWHDEPTIRWDCKGEEPEQQGETGLLFSRGQCFVYLPIVPTTLSADQAKVVIVKPLNSINIEARQSAVRIAENGVKYKYEVESNRSNINNLLSQDGAEHTISIKSNEAMISSYTYE